MSAYFAHHLERDKEEIIQCAPSDWLAVVDLESYQTFIDKNSDRLDLMAHLQNQMAALTAVAWGGPGRSLNIRLLLTEEHDAMRRVTRSSYSASASGWVRTYGRLCFTGHQRLFDCAHDPEHSLLAGERLPKDGRPHVLNVPSGIYHVLVYYHIPFPDGDSLAITDGSQLKADYTIVLHHHPHPARRMAPVRRPGFVMPRSLLPEMEEHPANLRTSHKMP